MGQIGRIHFARYETSERLQRIIRLLERGGWWGTREINRGADVCAVSTAIYELRMNGFKIETRRLRKRRYEYRLNGRREKQAELFG